VHCPCILPFSKHCQGKPLKWLHPRPGNVSPSAGYQRHPKKQNRRRRNLSGKRSFFIKMDAIVQHIFVSAGFQSISNPTAALRTPTVTGTAKSSSDADGEKESGRMFEKRNEGNSPFVPF